MLSNGFLPGCEGRTRRGRAYASPGSAHVREPLGDPVDEGDDLIALGNRQAAAGQEAVLHVDDAERRAGAWFDLALGQRGRNEAGERQAAGGGQEGAAREVMHGGMANPQLMLPL